MSEQHLVEALNDCINRLAKGQTLEDCLNMYPDLADELRSLLQVGQLSRQARFGNTEIRQMRFRLDKTIADYITVTDFNTSASRWRIPPGGTVLSLVAMMMLAVGLLWVVLRSNPTMLTSPTATPTVIVSETSQPPTPTATPSPSVTIISSATSIPTTTPSSTLEIPTEEAALTIQICELSMPEGWVEYRVRVGDTLSSIATQSGTTTEILTSVNCIENARLIVVGQVLFVPRPLEITVPDVDGSDDEPFSSDSSESDDNEDDEGDESHEGSESSASEEDEGS